MSSQWNLRFLLVLSVTLTLTATCVHILHGRQIRRMENLFRDQARIALSSGDRDQALEFYRRQLTFRPDDVESLTELAQLLDSPDASPEDLSAAIDNYMRLTGLVGHQDETPTRRVIALSLHPNVNRYTEAESFSSRLLQNHPEDPRLHYDRGRALEGLTRYGEAASEFEFAHKADPSLVDAFTRHATLLRDRLDNVELADRLMDVSQVLDGVIHHNPNSAAAYLARGLHKEVRGLDGATPDFQRALQLDPENLDVLAAASRDALQRGDTSSAIQLADRARTAKPTDPLPYRLLAQARIASKDRDGGLQVLRDAIKIVPERNALELQYDLASNLVEAGDLEAARAELVRIDGSPLVADAFVELLRGRILMAERRWPEASRTLESAYPDLRSLDPRIAYECDLLLALCYQRLRDPDRTLGAYRRAVSIDPAGIQARLGLAASLERIGQADQAIDLYRGMADRVPGLWTLVAQRLTERERQKPEDSRNWTEVEVALDRASSAQPDSVEVALLRSNMHTIRGQQQEARNVLTRAAALAPTDPRIPTALAALTVDPTGGPSSIRAALEEAERRQGDTVPLRLIRASTIVNEAASDARIQLAALELGIEKFSPEEREVLLRGLIYAYMRIEAYEDATRLLEPLVQAHPADFALASLQYSVAQARQDTAEIHRQQARLDQLLASARADDLATLVSLFDASYQPTARNLLSRIVSTIRSIEGEEGTYWRFTSARLELLPPPGQATGRPDPATLERVRQLLDDCARRRPNWVQVYFLRGLLEDQAGDRLAAIDALERARTMGARHPELFLTLYRLYIAAGRISDADRAITDLQGSGSTVTDPMFGRITAEVAARKDPAMALDRARSAVRPDSKDFRDHTWLAAFLNQAQKLDEAEAEYRRAVELAPDDPAAWLPLLGFLVAQGRMDDARSSLELARQKVPPHDTAALLARGYALLRDIPAAAEQFKLALQSKPEDTALLRDALVLSVNGSRPATESIAYAQKLMQLSGDQGDGPWARRSLALLWARDPQKRLDALRLLNLESKPETLHPSSETLVDELRAQAQLLALQSGQAYQEAAVRFLEALITRDPQEADANRLLLIRLLDALGRRDDASTELDLLLASNPDEPEALAMRVRWLLVPGTESAVPDPNAAAPWLARLEKVRPDSPVTTELRARWLAASGRSAEAAPLVQSLLQKGGTADPAMLAFAARLQEDLGLLPEAETSHRQLVQLTGKPGSVLMMARFLERIGKFADAEEAYRQFAREVGQPQGMLDLALFLGRIGKAEEAIQLCEQARNTCPPQQVGEAMLAVLSSTDSRDKLALRVLPILNDHLQKAPSDSVLLFQFGTGLAFARRYDQAIQILQEVARLNPHTGGPRINLAWLLSLHKPDQGEQALGFVQQAIDLDGASADALDTRAMILTRLDRAAEAIPDLERIVASARPPNPVWTLHLAIAYHRDGRSEEARRVYSEAIEAGLTDSLLDPLERPELERLRSGLSVR